MSFYRNCCNIRQLNSFAVGCWSSTPSALHIRPSGFMASALINLSLRASPAHSAAYIQDLVLSLIICMFLIWTSGGLLNHSWSGWFLTNGPVDSTSLSTWITPAVLKHQGNSHLRTPRQKFSSHFGKSLQFSRWSFTVEDSVRVSIDYLLQKGKYKAKRSPWILSWGGERWQTS